LNCRVTPGKKYSGSNADLAAADPEMILVPPVQQWSNFFSVSIPDSSPWSDFDAGFWLDIAINSGISIPISLSLYFYIYIYLFALIDVHF
jgi:hypothetical protein